MTENDKLKRDVDILETMAAETAAYLGNDILFGRLPDSRMPMMTLGGYLMRQQRLLALPDLLTTKQQVRVDTAVAQFNNALTDHIVRFEQKAHREIEARLRQWGQYLTAVETGKAARSSNYATIVETRVMIAALIDKLSLPPYRLDTAVTHKIALLDSQLRRRFSAGGLVWPKGWEPAYPQPEYWYLYGVPI